MPSPFFQDANEARIHLEAQRWPHGPNCPRCGNARVDHISKMEGKAHVPACTRRLRSPTLNAMTGCSP
ncbi:transposase [Mesorhizobium intechi]|uniref:transposase n=1 Tax=Mesorhizobium intechi TaxID=537601 RepID=UPI00319E128E